MATPVKMPQLGESIVEGTVARWLKAPGDSVERDEPLLDISTDKIDTEVPSPAAGVLLEIVTPEGETVDVGTILAFIGQEGDEHESDSGPSDRDAASMGKETLQDPATAVHKVLESVEKPRGRSFISPVVARIAAEHEVNLEQVPGSGMHGRITKKDILRFIDSGEERKVAAAPQKAPEPQRIPAGAIGDEEEVEPLTSMRRMIAEHMRRSVDTSPHVTTIFEVDMSAVVAHREANRADFARRGVKLTFTPYFVAAVAGALRAHPRVNSRWSDDGIVLAQRIHVGIAVALDDGLIVPVINDADEKSLAGQARAVNDLAERARTGGLSAEETRGGSFTITNHGVSGSLLATPIINQPQAGILGVGKIAKRAIVRSSGHPLLPSADDAIVIRPLAYLSFSFDHRILDGVEADTFVADVVGRLENWE